MLRPYRPTCAPTAWTESASAGSMPSDPLLPTSVRSQADPRTDLNCPGDRLPQSCERVGECRQALDVISQSSATSVAFKQTLSYTGGRISIPYPSKYVYLDRLMISCARSLYTSTDTMAMLSTYAFIRRLHNVMRIT